MGGLHEGKMVNEDTIITNREQISCAHEKFIALEKKVIGLNKEFNRKIELGRNLKSMVNKHQFNENILEGDMKEALQTYKLHGKNMDIEDIEWRGWQRDLTELVDIVGGNLSMNKGKSVGCGIGDFSDDEDFQMDCS